MKHHRIALLAICASPLLLASGLPLDKVSFTPAEGSTLTKTFKLEGKFEMDDMQVLLNGEENEMMPSIEMSMGWDQLIEVSDKYGKVEGGRPAKLTRTYKDISQDMKMEMSMEMMGQAQDQDMTGSGESKLEGKTVNFAWDDGAEEYAATFAEGSEGDEDLLAGLTEDMDLRLLLPTEEVSDGAEWDIAPAKLVDLFAPGGDLKWDISMNGEQAMSMGPGNPEMMSDMRDMLGEAVRGTATGHYSGMREIDGTKYGVIGIAIDIQSSNDLSDKFKEMMGDQLPQGVDVDIENIDMDFTFEGSGELLWDVAAGHVHSFELSGDVTLAMDMAMSMNVGQEMRMEMSMDMSGTIKQKVAVE